MTSYLITLKNDTLKVAFNPDLAVEGDCLLRDARSRLQELVESGQLRGGKLLKINGPQTLLISYLLAHGLVHLYSAVAVFDPRLRAYIVVSSNNADYPFGSRIDEQTGRVTPYLTQNRPRNEPSSVCLDWDGEILKVQLNSAVSADGDRVVVETREQLLDLIASGQIKGGKKPLLINGRLSVAASYVIAQQVAHLYSAIAVYDPKMGEPGVRRYVIVISHSQYQVGETIESECQPVENLKVVLCGPPNVGKTCFRQGLKEALLKAPNAPDSYVISGCPDGDGSWFSETARRDIELARQLKAEYKAKFTPSFATQKAKEIEAIKNSILIFDVGGKISPENHTIMKRATHALILAKTESDVEEWEVLCERLNLKIIAIVYSDYHATQDLIIELADSLDRHQKLPLLRGKVHYLDRCEDVSERPIIKEVARILSKLSSQKSE